MNCPSCKNKVHFALIHLKNGFFWGFFCKVCDELYRK